MTSVSCPLLLRVQTVYLLRLIFLLPALFVLTELLSAQDDSGNILLKDTLPVKDTPAHIKRRETPAIVIRQESLPVIQKDSSTADRVQTKDSVSRKPLYSGWKINPGLPISLQILQHHPYLAFGSKPVIVHSDLKLFQGKEISFYALIGLLLAFSLLRQTFPKYFNDLFRLLFRTTLKQKQIREQLMQTPVPSLLLNVFFAVSGGLYIDLLLHHFNLAPIDNFWLLFLYCSLGLAVIYLIKFFGLKVTGWLFNIKGAADSYIFVVYIINKVIGIFLLPFLILLSFIQGDAYTVAMICSMCGIGVLLVYRFLLTYTSVRNQVKFNPFHFFLYLCAFEIAPLLLIYKALLFFFP